MRKDLVSLYHGGTNVFIAYLLLVLVSVIAANTGNLGWPLRQPLREMIHRPRKLG